MDADMKKPKHRIDEVIINAQTFAASVFENGMPLAVCNPEALAGFGRRQHADQLILLSNLFNQFLFAHVVIEVTIRPPRRFCGLLGCRFY